MHFILQRRFSRPKRKRKGSIKLKLYALGSCKTQTSKIGWVNIQAIGLCQKKSFYLSFRMGHRLSAEQPILQTICGSPHTIMMNVFLRVNTQTKILAQTVWRFGLNKIATSKMKILLFGMFLVIITCRAWKIGQ